MIFGLILIKTDYYNIKRIKDNSMYPFIKTNNENFLYLPKFLFNDIILYKYLNYPRNKTEDLKYKLISIRDP